MIRIIDSRFVKSAVKPQQFPPANFAEIAFCGKSNVGKSSLINALLKRRNLAKVSRQPGKTRLINFFNVRFKLQDEIGFFTVVDLPGYGFAKVSDTEKEAWKHMISDYFNIRQEIRGIFVLVDIRHKADPKDKTMLALLKSLDLPFKVIATKSDKIPKSKVSQVCRNLAEQLLIDKNSIIPFSSLRSSGYELLINKIESFLL